MADKADPDDAMAPTNHLTDASGSSLKDFWTHLTEWCNSRPEISDGLMFFSPSLILILFTLISQIAQHSSHFALLMIVIIGFHAFLKFTNNPLSTKFQYRILYKCLLCFCILYFSPTLPFEQAKIMLAILFPLYYHLLTGSIPITLLLSFPILLFLFFSSLDEPFSNPTLMVVFIVVPTLFNAKNTNKNPLIPEKKQSQTNNAAGKKNEARQQDYNINPDDSLILPDPMDGPLQKHASSDHTSEEHDRVILGISHDCRNLLNSLKIILTFMKDRNNDEESEGKYDDDNLQSAVAITEHLILLLTNLLDYLRKNEDTNHEEETRLTSTLEKIWLMIAPNLKRKNLGGSITIKSGTPLRVQLDERKFMGILLNLVGNSTKFTDSGHIKINVSWLENSKSSQNDAKANIPLPGEYIRKPDFSTNDMSDASSTLDYGKTDSISFNKKCFTVLGNNEAENSFKESEGKLILTVRDTGCGMDDHGLKNLFKKYIQVGEDPEKSKLGYGLGLWYTKYLLSKLRGAIDFRSSKDVGTWAKVEIPCKIIKNKPETARKMDCQIKESMAILREAKRPYIFIKDDDKMLSLWISEYLKKKTLDNFEIFEINKIADIADFTFDDCLIIVGESSIYNEDMQLLRYLNARPSQKINLVILEDPDQIPHNLASYWSGFNISGTLPKPIRCPQLDELTGLVGKTFNLSQEMSSRVKDDKPHVLVVDDEGTSLFYVEKFLEKNGIRCITARNGLEAVEAYQKDPTNFKLILMDSEMPKMNGLEATKKIRGLGDNRALKIIGLTGNDSEEFQRDALESGMDGVLVKPVPWDQLVSVIETFI